MLNSDPDFCDVFLDIFLFFFSLSSQRVIDAFGRGVVGAGRSSAFGAGVVGAEAFHLFDAFLHFEDLLDEDAVNFVVGAGVLRTTDLGNENG